MKAVFIGVHSDDIEYSASGMAYLLGQKGFELHFIQLACNCRVYTHKSQSKVGLSAEEYEKQVMDAAVPFGAVKHLLRPQEDCYYMVSPETLNDLRFLLEDIYPDIAFIQWPKDTHWEHVQASRAAFQVLCEHTSCEVHAYEVGPWQTMTRFVPDFLVDITPAMDTIKESLSCFDSQCADGGALYREKVASAKFRGYMSSKFEYAEAYKILRYPPTRLGNEMMLPKLLGTSYRWGGGDQYPMGLQYFID